jgi:hypothetical protein
MPGAIGSLGPGHLGAGAAPHGNIRDNMGEESPRLGPVVGDFLDVLTLESDNPEEWKVAMTTVEKHTGARPAGMSAAAPIRSRWPGWGAPT